MRNLIMKLARVFTNRKDPLRNNDKFSKIIELAPDAFFWVDPKGNLIAVNNKAVELTGYSKQELLSMNVTEFFYEGVLTENPLRYDLLDHGKTIKNERVVKTKTGDRVEVEMNSRAMPDGTYQSFVRDVTKRKKVEEEVRVSEARLRRAELASKSGNWELHLGTQVMIGSEGATKIYGVDKDKLDFSIVRKVPLSEYRPMMDKALKELIEENKPYDIEFKIKAVDTGEIKDIHSIAIFDREKKILFGAIQDITQRKKIEEELIRAKEKAEESDKLKTAFLQNLSHEIRTPMNAIMGFSELMADESDDKEKLIKYSKIINQRSNDLLTIIDDILDIAKIESGQLPVNIEECNIRSLFEELTSYFIEIQKRFNKNNIKFSLQTFYNSSGDIILTDTVKLKQILINLINNAFKFTIEGTIEGGCKLIDKNNLLFYVKDSGIGIPSDKHEVIFERFIQLDQIQSMNAGGNGLGLSVAKGLVQLLGGEIFLDSEPYKGSTFSFTIPYKVAKSKHSDSLVQEEPTDSSITDKTILIVEDDYYNTEFLKEILKDQGVKTIQAANGKEAVELSLKENIDLVLMDIRLPDINGYEATRQIRKHKPKLKIIAQTAYASHNEKQKALDAGCNDYLSKPTKKDALLSMVNRHLATIS
ncbi:MAG: response regulator [Bacteroidales bacterium]|nr:response regulator [Bacteroidales bacterium]